MPRGHFVVAAARGWGSAKHHVGTVEAGRSCGKVFYGAGVH